MVIRKHKLSPPRKVALSEHEKVDVLLRKELKEGLSETIQTIADSYNIDPQEVENIKYEKLSPQGRALYKKRVEMLESKALALTEAVLEKGLEMISKVEDPKSLAGMAAIGKLADTIYRLENNKPTEISNSLPAEEHAIAFVKMLTETMSLQEAIEAFREASLEPLIPDWRKEEIANKMETGAILIPGMSITEKE